MRPLTVLFILTTSLFAQAPQKTVPPTFTQTLHVEALRRSHSGLTKMAAAPPRPVLASSADGATVFALLPLDDGRWELQVISGWNTAAPAIRTLQFEGDVPADRLNLILPQLTPSPDGRFLLVRTITLKLGSYERNAVVVLVDLKALQMLWRRVSTDPVVAFSRWRFSQDGRLIAGEGPSEWTRATDHRGLGSEIVPYDVLQVNPASPGEHEAAVLSLPELTPSLACRYRVPESASSDDATPDPVYAEDEGPAQASQPAVVLLGADCKTILKAAGVRSAAQLPGAFGEPWGRVGISACEAFALSTGQPKALMDCRDHHALGPDGRPAGVRFTDMRFSSPRAAGFRVRVGAGEEASATIARADGQQYLLVLRKGLKLEGYKLP